MSNKKYTGIIVDVFLVLAIGLFMMAYFDVRYLFLDTVVTGGDTASWQGVADHMMRVLLPAGRVTGWNMGNFCGYPAFTFYLIPPFLLAVLPAVIFHFPLTITLKLAIISGVFLFPLMTYLGLRAMKYQFPVPVIGASVTLLFLFNESYSIFGGNALSTFAGEFGYMFAFALFPYFIGSLYKGVHENNGAFKNGILLGIIGLSHPFVFLPAVFVLIFWLFEKGRFNYLFKTGIVAAGIMAFWILPLMASRQYSTHVYMIWHAFTNSCYMFLGISCILLSIGPGLALNAMAEKHAPMTPWSGWKLSMLLLAGLGTFSLLYLIQNYMVLGDSFFSTGLGSVNTRSQSSWHDFFHILSPTILPVSALLSVGVIAVGSWMMRWRSGYIRFCFFAGALSFAGMMMLIVSGLYLIICRAVDDADTRTFLLSGHVITILFFAVFVLMIGLICFSKQFKTFVTLAAEEADPERFRMFLSLVLCCATGYCAAHFMRVPDIRFLPPLLFSLMIIFFVDTLSPFLSRATKKTKTTAAVTVFYLCFIAVIFGANQSDIWFQSNNSGYESAPAYSEFMDINTYLKNSYTTESDDPLNAPRVGYEKCDMYKRYSGDRVFESIPLFSGRQTMEGILYESSIASRCVAFLQTAYSRDIKTPSPLILSKINPAALPGYFNLYNISQLILMTEKAKEAIASSPVFKKEADFGAASIYRYIGCNEQYVDVPAVMPVLYSGKNWKDDFYDWYKQNDNLDVLLVPRNYIKDKDDLAVFSNEINDIKSLEKLKRKFLDRNDIHIESRLEHLKIRFSTNKIGVPHLVKVSYFPNWKVIRGAHDVYPVSPHLMLVIPRENEVVLSYERTVWDRLGMGVTIVTLFIIFVSILLKYYAGKKPWSRMDGAFVLCERIIIEPVGHFFLSIRPYLLIFIAITSVLLITGGIIYRSVPVRAYVKGFSSYSAAVQLLQAGEKDLAHGQFRKAIGIMKPVIDRRSSYDHQDIMNTILFTAASYERLGQWDEAENLYRTIVNEYPYCRYVGESYVKLANITKRGRNALIEKGLLELQTGKHQEGVSSIKNALIRTEACILFFKAALNKEPYSFWTKNALKGIESEKAYIRGKWPIISSLCGDKDVRQSVMSILGNKKTGGDV